MAEDIPDSLEDDLAFLETGEQFLKEPSDANWQNFYGLFKAKLGPVPHLEQSDRAVSGAASPLAADNRLHPQPAGFPHLTQSRVALTLAFVVIIMGVFVLGIELGRAQPIVATTPVPMQLIPTGSASSNTARIPITNSWIPISQSFQGADMVLVPAGCWNMGRVDSSNVEAPVQQHCIDQPFWIDRTEVTNARYGSVSSPACDDDPARTAPDLPRNCVNWHEALAFCQAHGERLPTEAEWEWAARGPNDLLYPWGNKFDATKAVVVSNVRYPHHAAPVGSELSGASWVGALDMSGNVWDWTSSIFDPARFAYPYRADDGRENIDDMTSERVQRGGSWNDTDDQATTTYRGHSKPDVQFETFGFRCVRDIPH